MSSPTASASSSRDLLNVIDVHGVSVHRPTAEALVDPKARLKPIRVLRDKPVSGVEKVLGRATVLYERRGGVVGIALAEAVEVAERSPPPGEDGLIVVADDGDVAVRFREEPQQLELRVVRVWNRREDVREPRS